MHKLSQIFEYIINTPGSAIYYTPPYYKNAVSYFFPKYDTNIRIASSEYLFESLRKIDKEINSGKTGFGFITYEAGYKIENPDESFTSEESILSFYFCDPKDLKTYESDILENDLLNNADPPKSHIEDLHLNVTKEEYIKNINLIKSEIEKGNTYQVNYTIKSRFRILSDIKTFAGSLLYMQSAEYFCLLNDNGKIIISVSPELFFEYNVITGEIITKPMKGTVRRGINEKSDAEYYNTLRNSEKDKAENIMIVDMLRNDVGKIARQGSIKVSGKYEIKKYESLYQMITTVKGELPNAHFSEIIEAFFPCGSITGAPKNSTMSIIARLEKEKRGFYTGTAGVILPDKWVFNVPIRTIEIAGDMCEMGIGSGIVWDSKPEDEYDEVVLKSDFVTKTTPAFNLIETMLLEDGDIFLEDYHISRLERSADFHLFCFDKKKYSNLLAEYKNKYPAGSWKLRSELSKYGKINHEITHYNKTKLTGYNIVLSSTNVSNKNKYLYFKTTNRKIYNSELSEYRESGFDEVIYQNEKGNITEGAISNIILVLNGEYFTPAQENGLLKGTLINYLSDIGVLKEKDITINDIIGSECMFMCNSVFKLIPVNTIVSEGKIIKEFLSDNNIFYNVLMKYLK